MGLLKQVTVNQQAFLKGGVLGFAGSGKTYTATMLAIGIAHKLADGKPIAFFDTETGSDFLLPRFKTEGLTLLQAKSQSFLDLLQVGKEAESTCSVLIVDSITHIWRDICESYQKKTRYNKLEFQDWAIIKREWANWTNFFLNSKIHILICGRAGFEYDFEVNEKGKKELIKTGTKMKVENEFGFEPSLLIEMERAERSSEVGSGWIHRAHVLKDRTDTINGQSFDFQKLGKSYKKGDYQAVFNHFKPVFSSLNIGGEHTGFKSENNSEDLFDKTGKSDWVKTQQRIKIVLEEIEGTLVAIYPSTDTKSKERKRVIIESLFNTRSWSAVEALTLAQLEDGLKTLRNAEIKIKNNIEISLEDLSKLLKPTTELTEEEKAAIIAEENANN